MALKRKANIVKQYVCGTIIAEQFACEYWHKRTDYITLLFMKQQNLTEFERGYLTGLIVGEGSFTGDKTQASFEIGFQFQDLPLCLTLTKLFGGKLYKFNKGAFYKMLLRGTALKAQIELLNSLMSVASNTYKYTQFQQWLIKYNLQEYTNGFNGQVLTSPRKHAGANRVL